MIAVLYVPCLVITALFICVIVCSMILLMFRGTSIVASCRVVDFTLYLVETSSAA